MQISCKVNFIFNNVEFSRKELFKKALSKAKTGKVLYIIPEELTSLPELSQDISSTNRMLMKMISFLYANTLESLLESSYLLSEWNNVPIAIILDSLQHYCPKQNVQTACGVVATLIDSAQGCSTVTNNECELTISADRLLVGEQYCEILRQLYS